MIMFLMILYVVACVLLVVLILLQPSEGGGLSESFGGGQVQTIFGTKTTSFLVKTTAVLAALFLSMCLILAAVSSRKQKSLFEGQVMEETIPAVETEGAVSIPDDEPKTEGTAPMPGPALPGEQKQ